MTNLDPSKRHMDLVRSEDVQCPFCNERGFDHVGLRDHISMGWCNGFSSAASLSNWAAWVAAGDNRITGYEPLSGASS